MDENYYDVPSSNSGMSGSDWATVGLGVGGMLTDIGMFFANNKWSQQAANEQYSRQLNFWELQNQYNTPINQRLRLQAAGINPNVAYSNGNISNTADTAPSVPGNEYAKKGIYKMQMMSQLLQLRSLQADIGMKRATQRDLESQARLRERLGDLYGIQGEHYSADIDLKQIQGEHYRSDIKLKDEQGRLFKATAEEKRSLSKIHFVTERFLKETFELRKIGIELDNKLSESQVSLNDENRLDLSKTRDVRIRAMESQIAQARGQIDLMRTQGKLNNAEAAKAKKAVDKMEQETRSLKFSADYEENQGVPLSLHKNASSNMNAKFGPFSFSYGLSGGYMDLSK